MCVCVCVCVCMCVCACVCERKNVCLYINVEDYHYFMYTLPNMTLSRN